MGVGVVSLVNGVGIAGLEILWTGRLDLDEAPGTESHFGRRPRGFWGFWGLALG